MKNVFSISLGNGYIPLILVCYDIHYDNHVLLYSLWRMIPNSWSGSWNLIDFKNKFENELFFFKNSEMMPQICKYHEHTKYGYAQRLFLKQPQSHMKHELGQGHKDVMILIHLSHDSRRRQVCYNWR